MKEEEWYKNKMNICLTNMKIVLI